MEIGSSTKSPAPAGAPASPRAEAVAATAVRTELPADVAVQQPEPVRFQPSEGAEKRAALDHVVRAAMERHLAIDPETKAVVVQSVDPATGKVVRQIPDETLLKLRLYARELRDATSAEAGEGAKRVTRIA